MAVGAPSAQAGAAEKARERLRKERQKQTRLDAVNEDKLRGLIKTSKLDRRFANEDLDAIMSEGARSVEEGRQQDILAARKVEQEGLENTGESIVPESPPPLTSISGQTQGANLTELAGVSGGGAVKRQGPLAAGGDQGAGGSQRGLPEDVRGADFGTIQRRTVVTGIPAIDKALFGKDVPLLETLSPGQRTNLILRLREQTEARNRLKEAEKAAGRKEVLGIERQALDREAARAARDLSAARLDRRAAKRREDRLSDPVVQGNRNAARILDKIRREGAGSVTRSERQFLQERANLSPLKRLESELLGGGSLGAGGSDRGPMDSPAGREAAIRFEEETIQSTGRVPTASEIKTHLLRLNFRQR